MDKEDLLLLNSLKNHSLKKTTKEDFISLVTPTCYLVSTDVESAVEEARGMRRHQRVRAHPRNTRYLLIVACRWQHSHVSTAVVKHCF